MRLADCMNKYEDRAFMIVGKGPTTFDYGQISEWHDPVVFLNETVRMEGQAVAAPESFWFAHDSKQKAEVNADTWSTAVIPRGAPKDRQGRRMLSVDQLGSLPQRVMTYKYGNFWGDDVLASLSREWVAKNECLYQNSGTIHTALHFAWFCGAARVVMVGCSGRGKGYDNRLSIGYRPASAGIYRKIRSVQDRVADVLGMEVEYR